MKTKLLIPILLLASFMFAGCDGENSVPVVTTMAPNQTALESSAFFEGVIKVKEQRDLMMNSSEITYTITKGKIRREAVPVAPLGKLVDLGTAKAGVICDVANDQVLLYRSGLAGKFFVRMTLAGYRKEVASSIFNLESVAFDLPGTRPLLWRHVGTFFVYLPKPIPTGMATNVKDGRKIGDRLCDVLTIHDGKTTYETCHSQTLRFDRPLLELVELGLPAEVTGFPCQMRRLQVVDTPSSDTAESKAKQILKQGLRLAANAAEKALKYEIDLVQVMEGAPPEQAFVLDPAFAELDSWTEFSRRFDPPHESGGGDWD